MTRAELEARLRADAEALESVLERTMEALCAPDLLKRSMAYSLMAGGKRLRPALCLESCRMLGGDEQAAMTAACAMEMIHTYSLVHDDLPAMDNDALRRGQPTSHIVFGEGQAILAGDGLLSLAFVLLSSLDKPETLRAAAAGAFDMVGGQCLDLTEPEDEDSLFEIHRRKTGALIRAAVLAGAHCASPAAQELEALERYCGHFGLLFQITDDMLDVTASTETLGKTAGKDAADGKLTFVKLYGLEGARMRAEACAEAAREALAPFGGRAAFFLELTEATLHRKA
ncbi:MAG: polyprenyl synthetase family protein [Clostridia bacterium]|nr:polyprenyl synthetase family protein [Clostridia bacterium]